jgi:quinol monooxygenase YgiN
MSEAAKVGFVAIYRWRLDSAKVDQFLKAWADVTRGIKSKRGGLGSKIHREDDGTYVAYAQWPSREAWTHSSQLPSVDPDASKAMADAVLETFPSLLLDPIEDLLER